MQTRLLVPPTLEPVTLKEIKAYLRVTHGLEDDLIWGMAQSARKMCEDAARISISPQKWATAYRAPMREGDEFGLTDSIQDPERIINRLALRKPPVIALESVKLLRFDGSSREDMVDGVDYNFDPTWGVVAWTMDGKRRLVHPHWPTLEVVYTAGFPLAEDLIPGANPDRTVRQVIAPPDIIEAIWVTAMAVYENRGTEGTKVPTKALELLTPYWNSPHYVG